MMEHYDCLVVGSGACGATTAALVAQAGYQTLLLDSRFSRPVVPGESLLPAAHKLLDRLGLLDSLRQKGVPRHSGCAVLDHRGERLADLPFTSSALPSELPESSERDSPLGWHLDGNLFARMLRERAVGRGAEYAAGWQFVDAVAQSAERTLVRCLPTVGSLQSVTCRVLLETEVPPPAASFPTRRFSLASASPARWAVWGTYRHAQHPQANAGLPRIVVPTRQRGAWFWFSPLGNDTTSVGVIGLGNSPLGEKSSAADVFEEQLVQCPCIAERLIYAQLVGPLRSHSQLAAEVSPLFSLGLQSQLVQAERLADFAIRALASKASASTLHANCAGSGEPEASRARRFDAAFARPDFCLARFLREQPQHRAALLQLLAGHLKDESLEPLLTALAAAPSATLARAAQLS